MTKLDAASGAAGQPCALGRRPGLDGLRAIAVMLVVGYHVWPAVFAGGELGVEVFFVLSGFLITWTLLDEYHLRHHIDLPAFYLRRAARLLPALGLLLVVYLFIAVVFFPAASRGQMAWSAGVAATYGTSWALALGHPVAAGLGHLWSLAVEEQFYLLWPLVLLVVVRRTSARHVAGAAAVLAVASMCARELLWRHGASFGRVYFGFDTRCSSLLLGCALGAVLANGGFSQLVRRTTGLRAGALVAGAFLAWSVFRNVPRLAGASPQAAFGVAAIASGVILLWVVAERGAGRAAWLDHRTFVYIGQRSYGIYLWHFALIDLVHARWPQSGAPGAVAAVVVALIAADLSFRHVEQPALALRRRLAPRPAAVSER